MEYIFAGGSSRAELGMWFRRVHHLKYVRKKKFVLTRRHIVHSNQTIAEYPVFESYTTSDLAVVENYDDAVFRVG